MGSAKATICLVLVWAAGVILAMSAFSTVQLKEFDPKLKLAYQSADTDFDVQLANIIMENYQGLRNQAFHLTDAGCFCATVGAPHIASVKQELALLGFTNHELELSNFPELGDIIPSVPALLIFDDKGKLNYLGPYSSGYLCSSSGSMVDKVLAASKLGVSVGLVNTEAEGCYCHI